MDCPLDFAAAQLSFVQALTLDLRCVSFWWTLSGSSIGSQVLSRILSLSSLPRS